MAHLIGVSGKVQGQNFPVGKDRTTIGRTPANDITLDDPTVSANHCYIARRGTRFVLHDLNSTNGTLVNSKKITECELSNREAVQIGALEFMFEGEATAPAANLTTEQAQAMASPSSTVTIPKSFSSVSPFGTKRQKNRRLWIVLMGAVALVALAGLVLLVFHLFRFGRA